MKRIASNIQVALIDLDGTIFDSMNVWEKVDRDWLSIHNLPYSASYSEALKSKSFSESADFTIRFFGLDIPKHKILSEWEELALKEYENGVQIKPFAKEYLKILDESGIKLAVVTSLMPSIYEPLLHNMDIHHLFSNHFTTYTSGIGKHDSYIYQLAAESMNCDCQNCIVFEDVLEGIQSAKRLGMTVVGVYDVSSKALKKEIKKESDSYITSFKDAPLPFHSDNSGSRILFELSEEKTNTIQ